MIFNTSLPSSGGGSQGWTDITSQITAFDFYGAVYTDGHMCVITNESDQTYPDVDGVIILDGLPAGPLCYYTMSQANYGTMFQVVFDGGSLYATDARVVDPSLPIDAFTIIYPID